MSEQPHDEAARASMESWPPEPPSGMDRYRDLLARKHAATVTGGACGSEAFSPRAFDKGDHVVVWCDSCGVLLHRKYRTGGDAA